MTKPIPQYEGQWCYSSCNKQVECYHAEQFDEENGIVRSGLDFDIKHLPSEYPKDHYEVVWQKGGPMTKVEPNILLK